MESARRAGRMNQYDIWAGLDNLAGREAVYAAESDMHPDLVRAFDQVEAQPTITIRSKSGRPIETFFMYRCRGFKGWTPESPRHYQPDASALQRRHILFSWQAF
jgi:hypothetical protein